jgi:alanine dehydrogenase
MELGVLRETLRDERRVGLTPDAVRALVADGHEVVVETRAGLASGFEDNEYRAAGAEIAFTANEVAANAATLLKVRSPSREELELLAPGRCLLGFLHMAHGSEELVQALVKTGSTGISLELVQEGDARSVIEPLSQIGGRIAVSLAQYALTVGGGGPGTMLGGWVGVPAQRVVVIGAGVAGRAAAQEAMNLAAQVTVLDIDPRPLHLTSTKLGKHCVTAIASPYNIASAVESADVVIGAVARPGLPAPRVLTRQHLRTMHPGSLFVDLSIDEGGCAETSRPTTLETPIYVEEGVRHMCVPNLPSVVARTASQALSIAMLPYLRLLARRGLDQALRDNRALAQAVGVYRGELTSRHVARFHGGKARDLDDLLP